MEKYMGGKQAGEALGVHQRTLYQWEKKGWIQTIRTKGGKRLYDVKSYLDKAKREKQNRKYVTTNEACKILGVHKQTLYLWDKKGLIKAIKIKAKKYYDVNTYLNGKKKEADEDNKINICYVRVSSNNQKDDLERQIKYMKKKYPDHTIVKDIGSGINLDRKGLGKIIDWAIEGKIGEIIVAHKDRLARFGYNQIERLVKKYSDGEIIILNEIKKKEPQEELMEDVLQVMNAFVAKMNGMRKYK